MWTWQTIHSHHTNCLWSISNIQVLSREHYIFSQNSFSFSFMSIALSSSCSNPNGDSKNDDSEQVSDATSYDASDPPLLGILRVPQG